MEALCFAGPAATARAAVQLHAPEAPSPTVKLLSRRRCSCPSSRHRPCHRIPVLPSWEFASLSALTGISRPSGAFLLTAAVMQRYSVTAPACHFLRGAAVPILLPAEDGGLVLPGRRKSPGFGGRRECPHRAHHAVRVYPPARYAPARRMAENATQAQLDMLLLHKPRVSRGETHNGQRCFFIAHDHSVVAASQKPDELNTPAEFVMVGYPIG